VRASARRPAAQPALLAALAATAIGWNALVHLQGWSIVALKALPGFLAYFAAGMAVAAWVERRARRTAPRLGPAVTAALALAGLALVVANGYWHATAPVDTTLAAAADVLAALGFALVVAACAAGSGPSTAWLGHAAPAAVGRWSYGIYLWHVPLLLFGRWVGVVPPGFTGAAIFMLTTATLAGAASWHLIERPALERVRGRTRRPVPRTAPAPA
jgi:peptidoglycan/LPS O-acetylase OafA/YrhL